MFLHIFVNRSGTHDICDARLSISASHLNTLKIILPDQDTNKIQIAYWLWMFKNLGLFKFL